ncbi:MAG TPA: Gfo/Idh/MocA family oxidoreductase [Bryobacteraceae bacterium]|nr:Gfo/Idh/MocA family oxidoreductase [Bryobacteraceae bacterium]
MSETNIGRRGFLRGATALTALSYSRVMGANDRVQLGLIGCGARGRHDMGKFIEAGNTDVVAFCDIYGAQFDLAKKDASASKTFNAAGVKTFSDHRKLLDLKEVDVALIGVPDHWHTTIAIDALNAGKDVYVEKPLTLKIEEGPRVVKAARVNNRICQVGMQQRSAKHYLQAKEEYFDTGKLGKITLARTWWHGNSYHLRKAPDYLKTLPADLDWAHFLGQVKWRDWDPQQYWNWRAYLDYGGGQVTDLFTHWIDVVHMFMDKQIPDAASAEGGIYHYKDGRTAPDTINVLLQYPSEFTATFEATLVPGVTGAGIEMCGSLGRLLIDRQHFEFHPPGKNAKPTVVRAFSDLDLDHVQNFLACVRSRKLPNGDVLIGHRSAQASHLGNLSYMQKRRIEFDPMREDILPL